MSILFTIILFGLVGMSGLIPEINRSKHRAAPIVAFVGMILFYVSSVIVARVVGK